MDRPATRRGILVAALVAAVAAAVYLPSAGVPFLLDDLSVVRDDPRLAGEGWRELVTGGYWRTRQERTGLWRPLTLVSLAAIRRTFGPSPAAFHLANIFLHAACSLLVLFVGTRLVRLAPAETGPRARLVPALAALLFAVHPVHAEAVIFAVGLSDLLAAGLAMASLAVSLGERGRWRLPASLGMFFAALLAKESALALPFLTVAADLAVRRRGWRRALKGALPYLGVAFVWALLRLAVTGSLVPGEGGRAFAGVGLAGRLWVMAGVLARYVRLLLVPWPLHATYEVPWPGKPLASAAGALLLVATAAALVRRRFRPVVPAFGILWLVLALTPVSNVVPIGAVMAERFLYLPSAGFCLALAWLPAAVGPGRERAGRFLAASLAVVAAVFALLTPLRGADWRDGVRFWSREVAFSPGSAVAHVNLGWALDRAGDGAGAEREYLEGVRLRPFHPAAWLNLGILAARRGDPVKAERLVLKAGSLAPGDPGPPMALGKIRFQGGDPAGARRPLEEAIRLGQDTAEAWRLLGGSLAASGERAAAARALRRSLELDPGDPETRYALGNLLMQGESFSGAAEQFRLAIAADPSHDRALVNLGISLWQAGRRGEAREALEKAVLARPDSAGANYNLGRLLEAEGDLRRAAASYRRAAELRPDWEAPEEALSRFGRRDPAGATGE